MYLWIHVTFVCLPWVRYSASCWTWNGEQKKKTDPAHALMEFPVQPVPFDRTARYDRNVPHLCCPIW